jgi:hypothetical protein
MGSDEKVGKPRRSGSPTSAVDLVGFGGQEQCLSGKFPKLDSEIGQKGIKFSD